MSATSLIALAEEELRLVLEGRYDELDLLAERRSVVLASLPADLDLSLLGQAASLQALVTEALIERLDAVRAELIAGASRRDAAAGYARSVS